MTASIDAIRLLVGARATTRCDKCGLAVPPSNDAVILELLVNGGDPMMLLAQPRHLLPVGDCPGSPSRAQYLPGQPRDSRPEYALDERGIDRVREAYAEMQDLWFIWTR